MGRVSSSSWVETSPLQELQTDLQRFDFDDTLPQQAVTTPLDISYLPTVPLLLGNEHEKHEILAHVSLEHDYVSQTFV